MPWPTGPVSVGVNGENANLHIWVDKTNEAPASSMVGASAAQTPAVPSGNFQEMLLGHRSGGTNLASPLLALGSPAYGIGAAVSYGAATLTDTTKAWTVNALAGKLVYTNTGQFNIVTSNTATVLTMKSNWQSTPAGSTGYAIYGAADQNQGATVTYGASSLTDSAKAWTVNQWLGFWVFAQVGSAQVLSNTATVLTLTAWGTQPANNTAYGIQEPFFDSWLTTQRGSNSGLKVFSQPGNPDNL